MEKYFIFIKSNLRHAFAPVLVVTLLWIYAFFIDGPRVEERARKNFAAFNDAELNGHIDYICPTGPTDMFRINTDTTVFITGLGFYGQEDGDKHFQYFAKVGDSIVKHRHSDTLLLIRNKRIYYCYIAKYKD